MAARIVALYPLLAITCVALATAISPIVHVDAWGEDSVRIRWSLSGQQHAYNGPGALGVEPPSNTPETLSVSAALGDAAHTLTNGNMRIEVATDGTITATRLSDAATLATLQVAVGPAGGASGEVANVTSLSVQSTGKASASTSYYGFGEHENGALDQVLKSYDMESCIEYSKSRGGEVCLPFVMVADAQAAAAATSAAAAAGDTGATATGKAFQFGMLWNVGAYGGVTFGTAADRATQTWRAHNIDQVDVLLITTGAQAPPNSPQAQLPGYSVPNAILRRYVDAVGHAPPLPSWASGYWHSKNRYKSQDEVESTMATLHGNFSIPVSVFVVDYFNWAVMGNLTFDPARFPSPKAMVDKLHGYGTELMVSTWPFSQGASKTYKPLQEQGFAVFEGDNRSASVDWPDGVCGKPCRLYDASNPDARKWWWSQIKEGYFDYGIKVFWLDAAEPEQMTGSPAGSSFSVGSMQRTGMLFPYYHSLTYREGMDAAGAADGIMLSRSAWAGMSKHGAALWNGDTRSTFDFLSTAIQAGLSAQLSGIAWWTTDIGGYAGGNPADPAFRELIVRWFQFGLTYPLFRQHGARSTEPWLLGDTAFGQVRAVMALREHFRSYVEAELAETARSGLPLNRPLVMDFPADAQSWSTTVDDQYMFGRNFMAAPVHVMGARNRSVYFPEGAVYTHYFTNETFQGGTTAIVDAPLDHFPLFKLQLK